MRLASGNFPRTRLPLGLCLMTAPGESSPDILLSCPRMQRFPSSRLDLFVLRDFLSAQECNDLIAMIEAEHRPSTLADYNGDDVFRTSSTCDLSAEAPVVATVAARLAEISGIDP